MTNRWGKFLFLTLVGAISATGSPVAANAQFLDNVRGVLFGENEEEGGRTTGPFGSMELISLTPRSAASQYAIVDPNTNGSQEGKIAQLQPGSDVGLRFNVGWAMGDGWDINFVYTKIDWHDSNSVVEPPGGQLWANRSDADLGDDSASDASNDLVIDYRVLDLETGNRLQLGDNTQLRLLGGFRYARIQRQETIGYDGRDHNNTIIQDNTNLEGWGFRVGAEVHRQLGLGFSLFGKSSASLLVAEADILHREVQNNGTFVANDMNSNFAQALPGIDVGVGVDWRWRIFEAAFGYELTNWFNVPQGQFMSDDVQEAQFTNITDNFLLDGFFFRIGVSR